MRLMNIRLCQPFRITRSFLLLNILLISTASCTSTISSPASHSAALPRMAEQQQLIVDDATRSYHIYKPTQSATKGLPLMIVMHGGLGNAESMEEITGMNEVANKGQFVVAYPEGTGGRFAVMKDKRTWNAGNCCGPAQKANVDDVKFIKTMIQDIENKYAIDSARIYVAGHSNGGMMAYRLACETPDKIAAIISVSGTLAIDRCEGANNIPVLEIHGDADENVPLAGGRGKGPAGVNYRSVADSLAIMMKIRQCKPPTQTSSAGVEKTVYSCSQGAPVHLVVIAGGTHSWPGGSGRRSNEAHGFSTSNEAWQFAKNFSKAHNSAKIRIKTN